MSICLAINLPARSVLVSKSSAFGLHFWCALVNLPAADVAGLYRRDRNAFCLPLPMLVQLAQYINNQDGNPNGQSQPKKQSNNQGKEGCLSVHSDLLPLYLRAIRERFTKLPIKRIIPNGMMKRITVKAITASNSSIAASFINPGLILVILSIGVWDEDVNREVSVFLLYCVYPTNAVIGLVIPKYRYPEVIGIFHQAMVGLPTRYMGIFAIPT
jgi:hypothetical protein